MSKNRFFACLSFALGITTFVSMRPAGSQCTAAEVNGSVGVSQSATTKRYSKPSDAEIKAKLTPLQYDVTQHEGTEPAFKNEYWDNARKGIYVDVVTGEPLFSSKDMYKSGTGWPSFVRPLVKENVVEKVDRRLFFSRTEIRSKHGDSHLGHVFEDGPKPTGRRYCMNSAALRFIAAEDLEAEGYGEFTKLFDKAAINK